MRRFRTDQAVEPVGDFASADYDDSDRADACRAFVGSFEIYCSKIFHPVSIRVGAETNILHILYIVTRKNGMFLKMIIFVFDKNA